MSLAWPSTAFVDETRSDQRYYLAAVTVEDRRHDAVREAMRGLRITGSKLHWTKESDERRREIVDVIADVGLLHMVVMRLVDPDETDERARRKCLRRLLWELDRRSIERVVLEARAPSQNERDMQLVARLRRSRELRGQLIADHRPGPTEPLLWLADSLAGAV
jgi:hypothetical protein